MSSSDTPAVSSRESVCHLGTGPSSPAEPRVVGTGVQGTWGHSSSAPGVLDVCVSAPGDTAPCEDVRSVRGLHAGGRPPPYLCLAAGGGLTALEAPRRRLWGDRVHVTRGSPGRGSAPATPVQNSARRSPPRAVPLSSWWGLHVAMIHPLLWKKRPSPCLTAGPNKPYGRNRTLSLDTVYLPASGSTWDRPLSLIRHEQPNPPM